MVFIRSKRIKGREYYYLVKSARRGGKVQQIILEYLGSKYPSREELKNFKRKYEQKQE